MACSGSTIPASETKKNVPAGAETVPAATDTNQAAARASTNGAAGEKAAEKEKESAQ